MSEMSTGLLYAWVHEYQTNYVKVMVVEKERERGTVICENACCIKFQEHEVSLEMEGVPRAG